VEFTVAKFIIMLCFSKAVNFSAGDCCTVVQKTDTLFKMSVSRVKLN